VQRFSWAIRSMNPIWRKWPIQASPWPATSSRYQGLRDDRVVARTSRLTSRANEMVRRLIPLRGQEDRKGSLLQGGSSTWRYIQLASIWTRRAFTLSRSRSRQGALKNPDKSMDVYTGVALNPHKIRYVLSGRGGIAFARFNMEAR
jgi:hypothetical protein